MNVTSCEAVSGELRETADYLDQHSHMYLLVTAEDGSPIGYPMFGHSKDGGIEFSTYRKSAKVANALRNPHASCLVVPREGSPERRTLWVSGLISVRDDDEFAVGEDGGIKEPADMEVPTAVKRKVKARHRSSKRCILRIEIDQVRFAELPESRDLSR